MDSLQGQLLVASPYLPDPNFYRSVVLIIEHSDQCATGLVLNRPGPHPIRDVWPEVANTPCLSAQCIGIGGPMEGPLIAIHTLPFCADETILSGVYASSRRDQLQHVVEQLDDRFRIFSGYSGWGPGQLESELQQGGWMTCPATKDHLFKIDPEKLWDYVSRNIGEAITIEGLRIKHVPDDPSFN